MLDDWSEAEQCFERAQRLSDASRWSEALAAIEDAIEINPENGQWHGHRGYLLDQLNRFEDAIAAYEEAQRIEPEDRDTALALGLDQARIRRYNDALQTFEALAERHPEFEPAYCHRIHIYTELSQHDRAEEMFYLAQQIDDHCPHCFYYMGCSLLDRNKSDRAIYCYEQSLVRCPDYPDARRKLADAHRARGDFEDAKRNYLSEIRRSVGDTEVLCDLADLLLEHEEWARAAETCRLITEIDPKQTGAWSALGQIALAQDDAPAAVEYLSKAVACDSKFPGVQQQLGEAYLRTGRHRAALHHLTMALEAEPEDLRARMGAGNCLLEQGKVRAAADQYRQIIETAPELPGPYHNLAVCEFLLGRFEAGIEHCRKAIHLKSDYVLAMQKLSLGYMQTEEFGEASRWLKRARRLAPDDAGLRRLQRRLWRTRMIRVLFGWPMPLLRRLIAGLAGRPDKPLPPDAAPADPDESKSAD